MADTTFVNGTVIQPEWLNDVNDYVYRTASNGQILIGNGTGFAIGTLTAGTGISVTYTGGNLEIATAGGGATVSSFNTRTGAVTLTSGDVTTALTYTPASTAANTFTGAQILSDQQVSRAMLVDQGYTFVDKGNSGTTTQTLDYTAGSHQKITATGNHTIATSNWPPSGNLGVLLLELVNGGAYTLTWPTINWVKPDGTTTTSFSTWIAAITGRTALQTAGTDFIRLISRDGGTTIYGGFAL